MDTDYIKSTNQVLNWANNKSVELASSHLDGIMDAVVKFTGISKELIISNRRDNSMSRARKIFYIAAKKKLPNEKGVNIAKYIRRDHSTGIYYEKIEPYKYDEKVREGVDGVMSILRGFNFIGIEERLKAIRDENRQFPNYIRDNVLNVTYHGEREAEEFLGLTGAGFDRYKKIGRFTCFKNEDYFQEQTPLVDTKTGIVYASIKHAAKKTGEKPSAISSDINYHYTTEPRFKKLEDA